MTNLQTLSEMARQDEIRQLANELAEEDGFFQREHTPVGIIEYRVDTIAFQEVMDIFFEKLKQGKINYNKLKSL